MIWCLCFYLSPSLTCIQPASLMSGCSAFVSMQCGLQKCWWSVFFIDHHIFLHCARCRRAIVQNILNILPGIFQSFPPPSRLCSTLLCKAHMMPPSLSHRLPACLLYDIWDIYAFMAVGEEGRLMHEGGTVSEMLTSDSLKNKWNFYLSDIFLALMLICILKQKPLFGLRLEQKKQ